LCACPGRDLWSMQRRRCCVSSRADWTALTGVRLVDLCWRLLCACLPPTSREQQALPRCSVCLRREGGARVQAAASGRGQLPTGGTHRRCCLPFGARGAHESILGTAAHSTSRLFDCAGAYSVGPPHMSNPIDASVELASAAPNTLAREAHRRPRGLPRQSMLWCLRGTRGRARGSWFGDAARAVGMKLKGGLRPSPSLVCSVSAAHRGSRLLVLFSLISDWFGGTRAFCCHVISVLKLQC
jgi:hypothetical protein